MEVFGTRREKQFRPTTAFAAYAASKISITSIGHMGFKFHCLHKWTCPGRRKVEAKIYFFWYQSLLFGNLISSFD